MSDSHFNTELDLVAQKAITENALANCLHVQRERDTARARIVELEEKLKLGGLIYNEAETRIAELEAEIARLTKQWDEHCAFHGSESPHALQAALYRASDAESHCKALAEDVSKGKRDLATARGSVVDLAARLAVAQDATVSAQRAARARIAELEAEDKRKQKMLDVCNDVHGHNVKLKTRIDQAVAELESALRCGHLAAVNTDAVENALAALKGKSVCSVCGGDFSTAPHGCNCDKPAPTGELPEGWTYLTGYGGVFACLRSNPPFVISLERIRDLLATQGLRMVREAEWQRESASARRERDQAVALEQLKAELARRGKP